MGESLSFSISRGVRQVTVLTLSSSAFDSFLVEWNFSFFSSRHKQRLWEGQTERDRETDRHLFHRIIFFLRRPYPFETVLCVMKMKVEILIFTSRVKNMMMMS